MNTGYNASWNTEAKYSYVCVTSLCVFEVVVFCFFCVCHIPAVWHAKTKWSKSSWLDGGRVQNDPPLLLCCISDSTAAIHCSCVSPLEYVLTSGCMCPVLRSFPPFFQCVYAFMHLLQTTKD